MKKIIVNSPKYGEKEILVDDEDFDYINKWKWSIYISNKTFYARRLPRIGKRKFGKRLCIIMHRLILNVTDTNIKVDHKDHNGLNNQKNNIRTCTILENNRNVTSHKNSYSKYLGVTIRSRKTKTMGITKRWKSNIRINGILKNIKTFPFTEQGEIDAAKSYDEMAKKFHGEFANFNFK